MAGPVWGTAEIRVTADGEGLVAEIRKLAKDAGDSAGSEMGKSFNKGFDKETKKTFGTKFKDFFRDLNKEIQKNSGAWRNLSHNTRQWTLIIGAVAAALPSLVTLISAAGVGILALGSAFTSLGIGAAVTISVFKRFTGDLDKVPDDVKEARKEFDKLKDVFSELNGELTSAAFKNSGAAWASLAETVKNLQGPLTKVAEVVGRLVDSFAEWARINTGKISTFIENSARVFESLARSAGKFGDALLTAFTNPAMIKAVDGLTGWINDLADGFNNFVSGPGFSTWVDRGVSVFEHLGGLLESLGTALSGLFDQQTTDDLNAFIDGLGEFLEGPGKSLIDFLDELDVPGVVIGALNNLGAALKPIIDFATEFIRANPQAAKAGLEGIATGLAAIALVKITTGIVTPLSSLVGMMSGKNTSKIAKFSAALTGLGIALGSIASDPNAESGSAGISAISGALSGASIAGPIGGLVGLIAGLIASMITDVFLTPEVEGAWQKGWSQLFGAGDYSAFLLGPIREKFDIGFQQIMDFFGVAVPTFFAELAIKFAIGWEQIVGFFSSIIGRFQTGWQQIEDFFNISVPLFLTGIAVKFAIGWQQIIDFFGTVADKFRTGWEQIVTFFTVSIPNFFAQVGTAFTIGWNVILSIFSTFGKTVSSVWNGLWNGLISILATTWNTVTATIRGWWNTLVGIFTTMGGIISSVWSGIWNGLVGTVQSIWNSITTTIRIAVNTVTGIINGLTSKINGVLGLINKLSGGLINLKIPQLPGMASGGVLTGPTRILAGEAGPEAIVPLNRALSQVDPSVRWLSAIAQNKSTPGMASGGTVGAGRVVNIAPGAIQVNGAFDPQRTALTVMDRMAERIAG